MWPFNRCGSNHCGPGGPSEYRCSRKTDHAGPHCTVVTLGNYVTKKWFDCYECGLPMEVEPIRICKDCKKTAVELDNG